MGLWITSILDVPRADPEWESWTTAQSYCQPCFVKFLEEHVWIWFLDEEVKGGCFYLPDALLTDDAAHCRWVVAANELPVRFAYDLGCGRSLTGATGTDMI
jgi:hypothetical protein